jgi:hypothetical protein
MTKDRQDILVELGGSWPPYLTPWPRVTPHKSLTLCPLVLNLRVLPSTSKFGFIFWSSGYDAI